MPACEHLQFVGRRAGETPRPKRDSMSPAKFGSTMASGYTSLASCCHPKTTTPAPIAGAGGYPFGTQGELL